MWLRRALAELTSASGDPYLGASLTAARRLSAATWAATAGLALLFLPFAPPTEAVGPAGWALAAVIVLAAAGSALRLLDRERAIGFNQLLAGAYAGVLAIAVLQWLAGGRGLPYQDLLLLALVSVVGTQRPRRAGAFIPVVALAAFAPLAYDGWDLAVAGMIAANLSLWVVVALAGMGLRASLGSERRRMRSGEEEAQRLARVDGLTTLGNRRALDEELMVEAARSRRTGAQLSLAIVDMDGLKEVNDRLGHLEGDDCLRQVAVTLRDTVRTADRCFRWGGDEFVVILPDTPEVEAKRVCGRLVNAVRRSCATSAGDALSITCGYAQLGRGGDVTELMQAADRALLARKRAKRSRRSRSRGSEAL